MISFFDPKRIFESKNRKVVFSERPVHGFENIFVKKADKKRFWKYCKRAGVPEQIIEKIWKISDGYIENARYYIRIVKENNIRTIEEFKRIFSKKFERKYFIYISFFSATMRYFFYTIGFFNIGNIFAMISYIFMIFYFMVSQRKLFNP